MNLANKLTIFRIILVPIMIIVTFFNIPGEFVASTNCFVDFEPYIYYCFYNR